MSIVVNEWEVVPEGQRPGERGPSPPPVPSAPSQPLTRELERTLRLLRERAARLEAD